MTWFLASLPCADDAPTGLRALPLDLASVDWAEVLAVRDSYEVPMYPLSPYGEEINDAGGGTKLNPQPTFWAPLGTPVLAPFTGTVLAVPTLYSDDFSVQISDGDRVWEAEHVLDPSVAPGDEVVAGEPVAVVSDYECTYSKEAFGNDALCGTGMGLVELGLLIPGNPPSHVCPFTDGNLDPEAADAVRTALQAAMDAVEAEIGDPQWFDQDAWETAFCVTLDAVDG